jgi:tetratricopeptide (TPR) repeat protein
MNKIIWIIIIGLLSTIVTFGASISMSDMVKIRAQMKDIEELYKKGDDIGTIDAYSAIIKDYDIQNVPVKNSYAIYYNVGRSLVRLEKYNEALTIYEKIGAEDRISLIYLKQNKYNEAFAYLGKPSYKHNASYVKLFKETITGNATKSIKAKIRDSGKSFVGVEGKALIEQQFTPIATALNAPLFTGLEVALAAIDISVTNVDKTQFVAFASNIFDKVKSFEIEPSSPEIVGTMSLYLGVEEWNKFVKKYNGE